MYYDNEFSAFKYEKIGESNDADIKQQNWNTAFGLQAVDNLKPSGYMINLAKENVKGALSYEDVEAELTAYYSNQSKSSVDYSEKEADEVSLRIVRLLNDNSFNFSFLTLKQYHKALFSGVDLGISGKYIGSFRDYNISKKEPVLGGKSVIYTDFGMIEDTLRYDFDEEKSQKYLRMTTQQQIERIAEFTSRIWQVHPFAEGNTRTTAVFIQKYLNSMGFNVNNELFKDNSLYFRNALVRANFSSIRDRIESDNRFLVMFFENLLCGKNNQLCNDALYIDV